MSTLYKQIITAVFILLIGANIFVFISGVTLSDDISRFDQEIKLLHQENMELEKKLYSIESLQYAASLAQEQNFVKSSPVYIDNVKVANR